MIKTDGVMTQEIYDVVIHSRKEFVAECEQMYKDEIREKYGWDFDLYRHPSGIWCIYYCELFPCFDASDSAYENRCYRTLIFAPSEAEAFAKLNLIKERRLQITYLGVDVDYEELKPYINYNDR